MRLLIPALLCSLCLAILAPWAQGQLGPGALEENYRSKVAEAWVARIPWERRIAAARKKARSEGKLILAYFCSSYHPEDLPACEVFENGVLMSDWWVKSAKQFVPYLNISARLPDKPDQKLFLEKGGRYFPYFIIMDENGEKLVELRPINRSRVQQALEDARLKQKLTLAAESGENIAAVRGLRLLKIILREEAVEGEEEVERLAKTKGLNPTLLLRLEEYRAMLRVQKVFDRAQQDMRLADGVDEAKRKTIVEAAKVAIGKGMYELLVQKVDFRVESNPGLFLNFAIYATRGAIDKGDAVLGRVGLAMIKRGEAAVVPSKDQDIFRKKIRFDALKRRIEALAKKG